MPAIRQRVGADPPPQPEELSGPLWNACHGGQLADAQYLLAHGADLNWPAPWSGQTPLDIAEQEGRSDISRLAVRKGARSAVREKLRQLRRRAANNGSDRGEPPQPR